LNYKRKKKIKMIDETMKPNEVATNPQPDVDKPPIMTSEAMMRTNQGTANPQTETCGPLVSACEIINCILECVLCCVR
jgi:hypothetical protein